jgi:hypothetical protein
MAKSGRVRTNNKKSRRIRRGGAAAVDSSLIESRNAYLEKLRNITDCNMFDKEKMEFNIQRDNLEISKECFNKKQREIYEASKYERY